ncbi:MAG: ATP-dependent helicase HrpB [Chromatiaceae bacterium]|nr:MAG: ATP-dependent helicase HrpB [Chromatiaceae bacterium]
MPPLPIDPSLPPLLAALAVGHAVLTAPTGSGKTTRVPLALLSAPWLARRRLLLLTPRRPAARMAAARMAALLGEPVGDQVGYQVRFERHIGPRTRIEVLTEGILTRRLQADPELTGVGLVIFDEFHERSLQTDLALALALDTTQLRPDLRLLVMSATLDAAPVAALLGGAPLITGTGRSFPVTVHYAERAPADAVAAVAPAVHQALAAQAGDCLVFLPGVAEIARVATQLGHLTSGSGAVQVLPLHGSLPLAAQQRALIPDGSGRRVLLATDIAETSLTIEGIGSVVDSGLTRKPRFEPGRGLTRLVTEPISLAGADQRTGRAGRLGPGQCWRLWTRAQQAARPIQRPPEMLQADLAGLALELALWGVADPAALAWLDPPPAAAWAQAVALLQDLGALDAAGAVTLAGRHMARLPVHPRLARMLSAVPVAARALAADLAALLTERDPWLPESGVPRPADLGPRLAALAAARFVAPKARASRGCDPHRLKTIARASAQFQRLLATVDVAITGGVPAAAEVPGTDPANPAALLALAYPDRLAQNRGADGRFLLANGSGAQLARDDALALAPYLVVADLTAAGSNHRIRAALPIDLATVERQAAGRLQQREVLAWDAVREAVSTRTEVRLGALVLAARPTPIADPEAAAGLLLAAIGRDLQQTLTWTPAARQLRARVALLRRLEPDGDWPDWSDAWLCAHLDAWLAPWLVGATRLAEARALDLAAVLTQALGRSRAARLEAQAPAALTTPAETRRMLDYATADGAGPVLAAPLQEWFGAATGPVIAAGRVPVLLHLLSPAGRPLQVTRDLAAFWRGAYPAVRKEMRGRYPKHDWPEDPAVAAALAGGLRRRRRP